MKLRIVSAGIILIAIMLNGHAFGGTIEKQEKVAGLISQASKYLKDKKDLKEVPPIINEISDLSLSDSQIGEYVLIILRDDKDVYKKLIAVEVLIKNKDQRLSGVLIKLLKSNHDAAVELAINNVGRLKILEARTILEDIANNNANKLLRFFALNALKEINNEPN